MAWRGRSPTGCRRIWGQTVIVENKPGASTMIGGAEVARAPADGHTLFFTTDSSITSNPHLFKKMMYDPIKELVGVTQLIDLHQLVLVHPSVTANTVQELVALAKAQPDKLNYGSYGVGSQPHLLFEMLQKETGIKIQQVSYRGIAPAITAVIAGDVQMTLGGVSVAAGHIAGRTAEAARARPRHAREDACRTRRRCAKRASRTSTRARGSACSRRPARRPRCVAKISARRRGGAERSGVQGALHRRPGLHRRRQHAGGVREIHLGRSCL